LSLEGTFPFGWVRVQGGENWQLIWDPKIEKVIAKSSISKTIINLGNSSTWIEAKTFADTVLANPQLFYEDYLSEKTG